MVKIRYAQIRECDVSNGENIGVALFVQGCHFKCYNCFNPETWDFTKGKEWTTTIKEKFLKIIIKPYIKRVSILGGEPLADENLDEVLDLVKNINHLCPNKQIWIYSGYTWNDIWCDKKTLKKDYGDNYSNKIFDNNKKRQNIIKRCTILVDGRYIDSQRETKLLYKGSKNQRVININESLKQNKLVIYC